MTNEEKNRFAAENLGLVHALCKRFEGKGIEYEELYGAACLGLSKAIDRFEPQRGLKFSTYAFPVIIGELKRLFRDGGAVHVSRGMRELSLKISRLNSDHLNRTGEELTAAQLSEMLGASAEEVCEALMCSQAPISLTVDDDSGEAQLEIPEEGIEERLTARLSLRQALDELGERDKKIIRLRYYKGKTQTEVGKILEMSQVQVSRREKKILFLLREKLG